jgi:hypothetical protein
VPVDRYRIGADQGRAHGRLEKCEVIAQHDGDGAVLAEAQGRETAGRAGRPAGQFRLPEPPLAADDLPLHG